MFLSLGREGVRQLYLIFSDSQLQSNSAFPNFIAHRKLAGRLLCEVCHTSEKNQEFICELFGITAMKGKICLNQNIPPVLASRLSKDPSKLWYKLFISAFFKQLKDH